jgi:hypothetical protein
VERSAPPPLITNQATRRAEQPHNQSERDQPDETIVTEALHHIDDVADDAAEERQCAADQQRRDDRERQQHQADVRERADPHFDA